MDFLGLKIRAIIAVGGTVVTNDRGHNGEKAHRWFGKGGCAQWVSLENRESPGQGEYGSDLDQHYSPSAMLMLASLWWRGFWVQRSLCREVAARLVRQETGNGGWEWH